MKGTSLMRLLALVIAVVGLLPTAAVAAPVQTAAVGNRYLIADYDHNRVLEVDAAGAVIWRYGEPATKTSVLEAPARAFRLSNGNTMIVDNGEIVANPRVYGRVLEVSPAKTIVNQVTGLFLPTDVQVLGNGKWLISELSPYRRRVIEITPNQDLGTATVVYSGGATGAGRPLGVYSAVRLGNGNTLVSDHGNQRVVEVNGAGAIVRQVAGLASPTRVTALANGNWLIPLKLGFRVIEVNPDTGQIVWSYTTGKNNGNPDRDKFFLSSAERLANGNTLIADGENNRVIEVTPGGSIARTLPNPTGDIGSLGSTPPSALTCSGDLAKYGCPRDATALPDTTAPTISAVSVTPHGGSQRATGTVSGADPAGGGSVSGITTIQYSLDGTNWVTAKTLATPADSLTNEPFPVDLANPGAGGGWTATSHTVRVRLLDAAGNISAVATAAPFNHPLPAVTTTRYFAEGYTGGTFDQYLTLANPTGATVFVSVTFQYAGTSSGPAGTLVAIAANQRQTIFIDEVAGTGKELSLKLESNAGFYAERPMYFTNYPAASGTAYNRPGASALSGITGGHIGQAAEAPASSWSFAEGTTRPGFEAYFTIQNPGAQDSLVTIDYYYPNGAEQKSVTVGAGQRKTVVIHSASDPAGIGLDKDFSARLTTDPARPVIAERVMYFRYSNGFTATGGSATLGTTAFSPVWSFAEGFTGTNFHQYVALFNPNPTAATATLTYYIEGQGASSCQVPLPGLRRTTVITHQEVSPSNPCGIGANKANSLKVTADQPIVAERPMYFVYTALPPPYVDGGHNVMGATSLIQQGQSVILAEGYTALNGFHQYLTFQNPTGSPAQVQISYLLAEGGAPVVRPLTLAPNRRTTVVVHNSADPTGAGLGYAAFSTKVAVTGVTPDSGGNGILVERVMYFNYLGRATGGTTAAGTLAP